MEGDLPRNRAVWFAPPEEADVLVCEVKACGVRDQWSILSGGPLSRCVWTV